VTLSPCTHDGKTPPCTEAIVNAGISRVFYACEDPNPKQQGLLSAAESLIEAGIEVVSGLCEDEAKQVYRVFLHHIRHQRPYVLLKAAMSLDGKIAASDRQSKYLTGEASLRYVHQLRRRVDAIVVGIQTVLDDDPLLTVRYHFKPVSDRGVCRVVIDPQAQLHANLKLVQDDSASVLWVVSEDVALSFDVTAFRHIQVLRWPVEQGHFSWCDLLACFYQQFLWTFVMIEGGQGIYRSILTEEQVQEVLLFFAPLMLLSGKALSLVDVKENLGLVDALHFSDVSVQLFGNDICVTAYPVM
jgi:diaminohydroxyphosphoribosylaminopyrimidine deaminase/5-amino-6-(5-phosphoribosylamino)uracil reductase